MDKSSLYASRAEKRDPLHSQASRISTAGRRSSAAGVGPQVAVPIWHQGEVGTKRYITPVAPRPPGQRRGRRSGGRCSAEVPSRTSGHSKI